MSPMNGVMIFGSTGKLSPRYIRLFEILWTVGEIAYELALPSMFSAIHLVFHVSMLNMYVYISDESHFLQYDVVEVDDHLSFIVLPTAIVSQNVRQLCSRDILVVKAFWRHLPTEEAT
ncbi:hypothetical protein MTR67_018112 [Solanum verrucosum]|uniref:Tf2-1-like SH3-like domain-containing protein n=1 Tax=Solanum verrucosum TaxID=315347 RepID=A0AAF0TLB0_SOLVR|nr:hypothetical protein MTR67_018112 [Solanum verrucosum]